eukprot:scaffold476_cov57-Phaeocystis_antarctica.AAC.2
MAKLQRLRIQGNDLIPVAVFALVLHTKEKAARREHRAAEITVLELVLRVNCAVVRGAVQRFTVAVRTENRVIAGSDHAVVLDGRCLQDTHAAVEDVHLVARTHHQAAVGSACQVQPTFCNELLGEVERHLLQPAARLVGRLPPGQPLRAHRRRRPVLRL